MALKIGVDTGLFSKMKEAAKPMTPTELSVMISADRALLGMLALPSEAFKSK